MVVVQRCADVRWYFEVCIKQVFCSAWSDLVYGRVYKVGAALLKASAETNSHPEFQYTLLLCDGIFFYRCIPLSDNDETGSWSRSTVGYRGWP